MMQWILSIASFPSKQGREFSNNQLFFFSEISLQYMYFVHLLGNRHRSWLRHVAHLRLQNFLAAKSNIILHSRNYVMAIYESSTFNF